MEYSEIREADTTLYQKHDGTVSITFILNMNPGFECVVFYTDTPCWISLNPADPIVDSYDGEDFSISPENQAIIDRYIKKLGGYDDILNKLQAEYDRVMNDPYYGDDREGWKAAYKDRIKWALGRTDLMY